MQKYMFLFRGGEAARARFSPAQMQEHMQKWASWFKTLGEKGQLVGGDPFETTGKVLSGSKKTLSDGPFAEAKDVVGGYAIVNAKSVDDAVEIARGCPVFEYEGALEVRPLRDMTM